MDKETELKKINTELKVYINEASFVSTSCRNKLIRMLGQSFDISLPVENFKNIDVVLYENGDIEMRDEVYARDEALSFSEVVERYHMFQEKADLLLKRNNNKAFPNNDKNNMINLLIVFVLTVIFIALILYAVRSFFFGNFYNAFWLLLVIFSWLFPSVRDRFSQAYHYIIRKIKK